MFVHGDGSGCDLVKHMQSKGDLQIAWIMFDYVKRVESWTTLVCHVYNSFYYKVMMIVICDMQSKDMEVQCVMWHMLNKVMANNARVARKNRTLWYEYKNAISLEEIDVRYTIIQCWWYSLGVTNQVGLHELDN